jgi:SAM-dependent methyltransferase
LYSAIDRRELGVINSAVRGFCQKHYEFRSFKRYLKDHQIDLTGSVILDAGCGSGYSSQLIVEGLQPKELYAFDVLPEEIELARCRNLPVNFFVGDICDTLLPSDRYDAVFAFDVLHHVPEWRFALKELNRVLKKGGVLLVHEPRKRALDNLERILKIQHPVESRFEWPELSGALSEAGFRIVQRRDLYLGLFLTCLCIKDT